MALDKAITCGSKSAVSGVDDPNLTIETGIVVSSSSPFPGDGDSYWTTPSNSTAQMYLTQAIAAGTNAWFNATFRVSKNEFGGFQKVCAINGASGNIIALYVTSSGRFFLYNEHSGAVVGAESANSLFKAGEIYEAELMAKVPASGEGTVSCIVWNSKGEKVWELPATTASIGTSPATYFICKTESEGTEQPTDYSHLVVYDSTGTSFNTSQGFIKVAAHHPTSDKERTGWVAGASGTTELYKALNHAPEGKASASATTTSQIRDASNNATDTYRPNLAAYSEVGIAEADAILAVFDSMRVGSSGTTSTKVAVSGKSNPATTEGEIASGTTTAGTDPTGWTTGKSGIAYSPTVVNSEKPAVTVRRATANTQVVMVDMLFQVTVYQPVVEGYVGKSMLGYSSRTSAVFPTPTGTQPGDVVVIDIGVSTPPTLTGGELIAEHEGEYLWLYVIPETVPATITVTWGGVEHTVEGAALTYRGIDNSHPLDAVGTFEALGTTTTPIAPPTKTLTNNATVVSLVSENEGRFATPPTGFTERVDTEKFPGQSETTYALHFADAKQAVKGATGEQKWTFSAEARCVGLTFALRKAGEKEEGGATPVNLSLSTIAGQSGLSATMSAKTALPMSTISGQGGATAVLAAKTALPLSAISAQSGLAAALSARAVLAPSPIAGQSGLAATVVPAAQLAPSPIAGQSGLSGELSSKGALALSPVAGVHTLAAAMTAQTALPLGPIAGVASLAAALSAKTALALSPVAGQGSASAALTAAARLEPSAVASQSALSAVVTPGAKMLASPVAGQSTLAASLRTGITLLASPVAGQSTLAAALSARTLLALSPVAATHTLAASLKAQTTLALSPVAGQSGLAATVGAPIQLYPSAIEGHSSVTAAIKVGHVLPASRIEGVSSLTLIPELWQVGRVLQLAPIAAQANLEANLRVKQPLPLGPIAGQSSLAASLHSATNLQLSKIQGQSSLAGIAMRYFLRMGPITGQSNLTLAALRSKPRLALSPIAAKSGLSLTLLRTVAPGFYVKKEGRWLRVGGVAPGGGWILPTLINGWANYEVNEEFETPRYKKNADGLVTIEGIVAHAAVVTALTQQIFQLPDGYRPRRRHGYVVNSSGGVTRVDVLANGAVLAVVGEIAFSYLFVDGLSFYTN